MMFYEKLNTDLLLVTLFCPCFASISLTALPWYVPRYARPTRRRHTALLE